MILQASVTWCLCCNYITVDANSEKYISDSNCLNVFKPAGYVIPSIMNRKKFQVTLLCWCVCHMQRSETGEPSRGNTMPNLCNQYWKWHQYAFSNNFYASLRNSKMQILVFSCLSVCLHTTTWLPLDGFSRY